MIQHNGLNLRYNQVVGMEHDETLSGDGSNQSPLGVMWSSLPNDVVKSADIADMATTGDIDSLVTSIAETYQTTAGMTAYQSAGDYYSASNPSGFITEVPTGTMNESAFGYDGSNVITGYNGSAFAQGGGGSAPTYGYTDNGLISSIDTSGLFATSAGTANYAKHLITDGTMGNTITYYDGTNRMVLNPYKYTPFGTTSGIYGPLQYATGAVITYGSSGNAGSQYSGVQYFGGFFKGNEWYISNATAGQALRGETHASRGVHLSGATTAGYGFNLGILSVSGVNSTGSWKYGYQEDAALRAVSSCDMHESAFSYDASDNITAYNGSAFKAGDEFPQSATEAIEAVTANSGAWGGSALPISAGPGIKLAMVNGTLVASNDETVLWSGVGASEVTLSESFENFEYIKLVHNTQVEEFWNPKSGDAVRYWHKYGTMAQGVYKMAMVHLSMPDATHIENVSAKTLNYSLTSTETAPISVTVNDVYALNTIREVIGINRTAGGN